MTYSFYRPHTRSATWYTGELVNPQTGEIYKPVPRTKQSFVAECDINNILKQYKLTGQIRHISAKAAMGAYQDLPEPLDFQQALNTVLEAQKSFSTLPSHIRARFDNDPASFLGFMSDPANAEEIIKLGLTDPIRSPPEGVGGTQAPEAPDNPKAAPGALKAS